jgi:hypothetical protein
VCGARPMKSSRIPSRQFGCVVLPRRLCAPRNDRLGAIAEYGGWGGDERLPRARSAGISVSPNGGLGGVEGLVRDGGSGRGCEAPAGRFGHVGPPGSVLYESAGGPVRHTISRRAQSQSRRM